MEGLSRKQALIRAFEYTTRYDALVCNGAVRSGKTSIMTVSFVDWAMRRFRDTYFAICSKTVQACYRNVIRPYLALAYVRKRYAVMLRVSDNYMTISAGDVTNTFYIFGGRDESSYTLIQGVTLGGVLLDEAPLMPESFVNQATARCSLEGARFWFNCNPAGSMEHWFYKAWIKDAAQKRALVLNFTLDDNPSLSEDTKNRYKRMYSGVFYQRYVLGQWVMAEGLVYPGFESVIEEESPGAFTDVVCSMDYGTQNATAMLLWGKSGSVWHCFREYYHSGRDTGRQKTDDEYYDDLLALTDGTGCRKLIIDPSAASFIALIRRKGHMNVQAADNAVLDGIRETNAAMRRGLIQIDKRCKATIAELGTYAWDEKAADDRPLKTNDHAMDAMRYFVKTMKLMRGSRQGLL